jgi:pseudouridylate synthase
MLRASRKVQAALDAGRAVVALESTVLAHGLPRPRNLEAGRALEETVGAGGGVPATVAVLDGTPTAGLDAAGFERIALGEGVAKLSTRDLAVAAARRSDGATTVAATMWIAHRLGIEVFSTGGIGGVHRGELPDVSADLLELGRTPTVVVCAGAKSILDLAATREALESSGVLVAGWGTDQLPGFWTRETGLPVDVRVDSAREAAELWRAHRSLAAPGALLLCVPPPEGTALPAEEVEAALLAAERRARREGVGGKALTPFLLAAVAEETGGRSLEANLALLLNNAAHAARVARELVV